MHGDGVALVSRGQAHLGQLITRLPLTVDEHPLALDVGAALTSVLLDASRGDDVSTFAKDAEPYGSPYPEERRESQEDKAEERPRAGSGEAIPRASYSAHYGSAPHLACNCHPYMLNVGWRCT